MATKQEQMDGWVSADWSHRANLVTAARKAVVIQGSWQEIMCQVVSGLWPQQGQRSLSHLPCLSIMCPTAECPLTNLDIQRQYRGGEAAEAYPMAAQLTSMNASTESRLWQERYSWIKGEFRVKITGPWGSVVSLVPLGREHHQDSPARGPTGRLGMDWEMARRR